MYRKDPELNIDRFYLINLTQSLMGEIGVERNWGRTGTDGHRRLDWFNDSQAAIKALKDIVQLKTCRGYVVIKDDTLPKS